MAELADVVELLRSSGPRCHTLQAVGREWRHHALLNEAFTAERPPGAQAGGGRFAGAGGGRLVRTSGEPWPDEGEETWRWWSEEPDRLRVEFAVGDEMVTAWFQGTTWWDWSPSEGPRTNEGLGSVRHGKGPGEVLISPARAARALDFELLGELRFLARPAHRLRARSFTRGDFDLHALGLGADEYEFVVDAERGFLLRAEARLEAKPFRVLEMTEVAVDTELPASVFTPQAPEGERFERLEPTMRLVSLDELPAAVPFKVFVPAEAPGQPGFVHVLNPRPRRGTRLSAMISYFVPKPDGGHGNLWIEESAEAIGAPRQLTEIWRQVDGFMVSADQSMGYLRCKVLLDREGTHIRLESTAMAVHELIALARSLVPFAPGAAL